MRKRSTREKHSSTCSPTGARALTPSSRPMTRRLSALLLFTLILSLFPSSALGRPSSAYSSQSASSQDPGLTDAERRELERARKTITQLLDEVTNLTAKLTAAQPAIEEMRKERDEAKALLEQFKREVDASQRVVAMAEKVLATADLAIKQQQSVIESMEKGVQKALALVERYDKRVGELEVKLDKANSRTVKAGLGGFLAGVLSGLLKIF